MADDAWQPSVGTMMRSSDGGRFVVLTTGGWMDVAEMMRRSGVPHDPFAVLPQVMADVARLERWKLELKP